LIYHWTKEYLASTFLAKESYKLPKHRKNTFVNLKTMLNVLKETVPAEEFKGCGNPCFISSFSPD
jgi:hypothetical protein